ncbi:hypothetical protein [Salegentibacter salarius]|uniref:Uncharacterized protein n=1 Tax=Salegentibacter salarius TaxID=435906 RepID=A0A2N0U0L2_9FLAO|nr:hypothetical protein [Salegentibacter salarius]OEY73514.1 hypothetical protein BHS39_08640 [Salegentibacter salarius]PKD20550.1 hypothetical protein APR40_08635 [Salegentibacter salarius]SLJ95692.1 hypothetical protein SAMN05660445_01760 [Salegentibacter salarius]
MESNQEYRKKSGKSKSQNTSENKAKSKDIKPTGGNKFEKNLKEKLKERKIEPSAETWEKLNAKLNVEENKTSRKSWKYIAAAVAVLLVAGTFLWNPNTSESPQIVEEPVNNIIEKPAMNKPENDVQIASEENNREEKISAEKEIKNKVVRKSKPSILAEKAPEVPVLEEVKIEEAVALETISLEPPVSKEKIIQSKLEEIIASAAKNDEISEDEVDILLAEAASEISRERNLKLYTSSNEINANALLAEVEGEIYQSFKAKVFEVLKEGYLKAKTAVANRNY